MKHQKRVLKFNRSGSHRNAMVKNMMIALILNHIIKTTLSKAKILRQFIEPVITRAKINTIANRRLIFAKIRNTDSVIKLFTQIGPHFYDRPGGYTRILKCGFRKGDNAPMAYIELVDRSKLVIKS